MSKKACKDIDELSVKLERKAPKYYCKKCDKRAPKEKWLCKPKAI